MNRDDLHALVSTLPDGAIEHARRMLEHLQSWPPQVPPEVARIREIQKEQRERMLRSVPPGTAVVGGGGSNFNPAGYGHSGFSRFEGDTAINDSHHLFKGHEIAVIERLRFTDDGGAIRYTHEVRGPKGETHVNEMTFSI